MKVLHIDSSMRGDRSVSKELSALFVNQLKENFKDIELDYLDLSKDTPSHPSALFIRGNYSPAEDRTDEMRKELGTSDKLVDRMIGSDIYVIGMPMHNFSVPSIFKSFIDNIVRIDRTFKMTETGVAGLLLNKKVFIITTRGADFNNGNMMDMDHLQPYLATILGFLGIADLTFINVSPVQFANAEARENALKRGREEIIRTVQLLKNK